jgi:hypothetical protein
MARRKAKPKSGGRKRIDKQLERFKETARMLGIDENSETFARAFAKLSRDTRAVDIEDTRPARSMTK